MTEQFDDWLGDNQDRLKKEWMDEWIENNPYEWIDYCKTHYKE